MALTNPTMHVDTGVNDVPLSPTTTVFPASRFMRWLIYLHLAAVAMCALFSLADGGFLWSKPLSQLVTFCGNVLLIPSLLAWVLCPVGTLMIACCSSRNSPVIVPIFAEAVLFLSQFIALLPACQ